MTHPSTLLLILLAYLFGALPAGLMVGRMVKGIDIRDHGSGNIGASNVWRMMGPLWGTAVFLFDFCKGYIPTLLTQGVPRVPDWLPVLHMTTAHTLAEHAAPVSPWLPRAGRSRRDSGPQLQPVFRV